MKDGKVNDTSSTTALFRETIPGLTSRLSANLRAANKSQTVEPVSQRNKNQRAIQYRETPEKMAAMSNPANKKISFM